MDLEDEPIEQKYIEYDIYSKFTKDNLINIIEDYAMNSLDKNYDKSVFYKNNITSVNKLTTKEKLLDYIKNNNIKVDYDEYKRYIKK
jgi:hypothetical protein